MAEAKQQTGKRILLVDDDNEIVDSMKLALESKGYQILVARDGNQGLALAEREDPDLMILDVIMEQPDDGIAMAQDLRRTGFTAPIIMLTSISKVTGMTYGEDSDLVPVNDFLEKPIAPKALIAHVKGLLAKKEVS